MSYEVKQGNIFGRIGTGIGKGFAEQFPKDFQRERMAEGLKELGEKKGLTPFQQLAGFYSVPGAADRPELIRSGTEFLKQQAQRGGYLDRSGMKSSPDSKNSQSAPDFANLSQRKQPPMSQNDPTPQGNYPSGEPQIVEKNPLSKEFIPAIPWTAEQRDKDITRIWDQNPQLSFPEVSKIVSDNEKRYLESPSAYRSQQDYLEGEQKKVNDEIDSQLRKKLHISKDKEIFDKLSGENVNRIERGVSRDLRKNPDANVKDLVNTWTDRALNNGKDKSELKNIGNRSFDEKIGKQRQNFERIESMSKSFKDFGNSEELYNTLREDPFGLSPEGAASLAYPLSRPAQAYVNKIKVMPFQVNSRASEYASNLSDFLTREDSILSIAKSIKEKDPSFNPEQFLSEVRNIQDELSLSPIQKRELETRGSFDIFPNWGDTFLFPRGR